MRGIIKEDILLLTSSGFLGRRKDLRSRGGHGERVGGKEKVR